MRAGLLRGTEPAPSTSTRSAFGREDREALQYRAEQPRLHRLVVARLGGARDLALHHHLRADLALGLQQHRVHVHAERHPRGTRVQGLGAADLAAICGNGSVVRHVLRLEGAHAQAAACEGAGKTGHHHRLADIRARALDHQSLRTDRSGHQNSMPSCAFYAGGEVMLHRRHLGDEVGRLDQLRLRLCVAAGDDDVLIGAPRLQGGDHLGGVEMVVTAR